MARLIWTQPALADLEAIADYMALDKPDAASRYVQQVFAAVERWPGFQNPGPGFRNYPICPIAGCRAARQGTPSARR